ncbi:MAG: cytochrome c maturation protein CcmE [Deltaproteobacteria bacterium]|jgi:cytochrome c-type biogenesis protein CcmE|nr:cytochrome c maturation protein CcmE [Deltaproteobacteria bacterium]MBW2543087.1 cytochrome c maturation protein CcmE [Deltaproteobacteria bacterium]
MTKGVQIAIGATVIAGLLGWYGASNLDAAPAFAYYETLEAFQANADAANGARSRFHGYVTADSIRRDVEAMQVRFLVQNDPTHASDDVGTPVEVVLKSLETPDLFKDGAEVVVEGRMVASSSGPVFEADKIMAKCPSKFEAEAAGSTES